VVLGLLWLRKAATEAGSAPFSMAQVATECRNLPGVNGTMHDAFQVEMTAIPYFSRPKAPRSSSRFPASKTSADAAVRNGSPLFV
jgi:hypothetical protein